MKIGSTTLHIQSTWTLTAFCPQAWAEPSAACCKLTQVFLGLLNLRCISEGLPYEFSFSISEPLAF